jgi:magnesium transporter
MCGISPALNCYAPVAMINLEFIGAIVTAKEVLLLDPLMHEVPPFVDQLSQHLPLRSLVGGNGECAH